MFEYSDCKNFEFHTVVMAGNASKCCWPHRKQEMKLHSTTIISKYLTLIALFAWKSGGGGLDVYVITSATYATFTIYDLEHANGCLASERSFNL